MSTLPRPWSHIKAEIEVEIAARLQALRAAEKPHDFRFIQGELAGLERALQIAARKPDEPANPADDAIY